MNRKETTEFLSNLLVERLSGRGKYYASEVTLDYSGGKGEKNVLILYNSCQKIKARVELKKASLFFTKSRVARLITIAATA